MPINNIFLVNTFFFFGFTSEKVKARSLEPLRRAFCRYFTWHAAVYWMKEYSKKWKSEAG